MPGLSHSSTDAVAVTGRSCPYAGCSRVVTIAGHPTSTMSSTSTGALSGSSETPDGGAGMGARFAEQLTEQLGRAVDDAGLSAESRCGGDEADDLDHPGHRVDADEGVDGGQRVERADPGELFGLLRH